jgi:hypothetical protein
MTAKESKITEIQKKEASLRNAHGEVAQLKARRQQLKLQVDQLKCELKEEVKGMKNNKK